MSSPRAGEEEPAIRGPAAAPPRKRSFVRRHLDPGTILGEVLFGLIMVLTITLTAGIAVSEEKGAVRELLIAALGCNIAWGLIDGVMHIMNSMLQRGRLSRFIAFLNRQSDAGHAMELIAEELDDVLAPIPDAAEREQICRQVLRGLGSAKPERTRLTREDLLGAIASFWLVFFSALPAVLPFAVMSDARRALRTSNFILIVMLFLVGVSWARYTNTSRWAAGLALTALGLVLVGIAIALGG
jgi:VIT1/CCC1 family predicted Fe2+/Mn2+ transporter